jgi:VWFA-related protein
MRRHFLGLCIAFACAIPALSQDHLVNLNVVVLDGHGQPVSDLDADDFQLQDQGKRYRIAVFHKNDATAQMEATAPLGPHDFANRGSAVPPSVTLILLDLLNLAMDQQGYARNQLVTALRHLESPDYVYIYLLTVRVRLPSTACLRLMRKRPQGTGPRTFRRNSKTRSPTSTT